MPINYKNYDASWKTKIRPDILKRDGDACKICKVKNGSAVFRGFYNNNIEVFQDFDGNIYKTENGEFITCDCYEDIKPSTRNENQKAIRIVLTIAHLDNDTNNNLYGNLAALCQLHHLRHDSKHHAKNARATIEKKKNLQRLF
jgi:hypothetical protein